MDRMDSARPNRLKQLALWAMGLLFVKTFFGILWEYQWYLPPDYDLSAFLGGRRYTFDGLYRTSFYIHIFSGPPAIVIAVALFYTGGIERRIRWHRLLGKIQFFLVILVVVPSGLFMAGNAYGGVVAQLGFAALSLLTGVTLLMAVYHARSHRIRHHKIWAQRTIAMLLSPILLRLFSGVLIVTELATPLTYQANAWISWLVPLGACVIWQRVAQHDSSPNLASPPPPQAPP